MGGTQISVRAVPAPAPMVIPEIEGADQPGDSVREQLVHPTLSRLRGEIPEAEQAEEEADEHTDDEALRHRADPRGLELAAPLAPVERVRPDEGDVVPADGMAHEPVDLSRER